MRLELTYCSSFGYFYEFETRKEINSCSVFGYFDGFWTEFQTRKESTY